MRHLVKVSIYSPPSAGGYCELAHLEGLEGEPHVEALGDRDPPHTFLGRPVVIGVVGRLDLASIFVDVSATGSFTKTHTSEDPLAPGH